MKLIQEKVDRLFYSNKLLNKLDIAITSWMKRYGVLICRISLAIIFIWVGILKPIGVSAANELVTKTVYWFNPSWFIPLLGWWEVLIGICLLYKPFIRLGILLMALQMGGTFLPMILLPDIVYGNHWYVLTLEGQYIVKNLALISAAIVIGSQVRDDKKNNRK
ncbi:hypothetical protein J4206_03335 [Candidatus Woesearchaeota archaeon]|nr:hypothetical protein [Candidatus Woesearchaeota archaeon]